MAKLHKVGKIIRTYKILGISDPLIADRGHFLWDYREGLPDTFEGFQAQRGERCHNFFVKYAKNHLVSSKSMKYHT
jgi:hypothetical protein